MITQYEINPRDLVQYMSQNIREYCSSCKRFNTKACCPPHVESVEYYRDFVQNYNKGLLVIAKFKIDDIKNWVQLGKNSSETLRKHMINLKSYLLENEKDVIFFGAGSCKHCARCTFPCIFPEHRLIPIEAMGMNVVGLVWDVAKILIKFPVEEYFYRVGVILWERK